MRDFIVYVLLALVYKVESRTFCDDQRCLCSNKENSLQVTCSAHPAVLEANYSLPNNVSGLDLSRNNLTRLAQSPSLASETLKELLLVNNQIKEITVDAFRLPSLELLDLSHNLLEVIHVNTFSSIKNLKYLNLANNKFNAFENLNFYHLDNLRHLVLDNNDIGPSLITHSLFAGGYNLTNKIQSISLNNINLNSENKHIFKYETNNLKNLTLVRNNITDILDIPENLEYLDISNNPIQKITGNIFFFSIHLKELKLNNILLEEVPDYAFFYLTTLRNLELGNNKHLKKFSSLAWGKIIPKDTMDLPVENLTLRGANLTSLDSLLERIFKKIRRVDLRDNPWRCDCGLSWLLNIPIPKEFDELRCSTPHYLLNKRVLDLKSTDFVCGTSSSVDYTRTSINILVYCTLLVLTVIMMYLFIFAPRPFMYRELPVEFPRTP